MKDEIILYQSDDLAERIEVRLEDETVWLSQQQMTALFNQTKQNISLHINNCFVNTRESTPYLRSDFMIHWGHDIFRQGNQGVGVRGAGGFTQGF